MAGTKRPGSGNVPMEQRIKGIADAIQDPDTFVDFIGKVGIDATILALGAYLGYNGYTPVTALMNTIKSEEAEDIWKFLTTPGWKLVSDAIDEANEPDAVKVEDLELAIKYKKEEIADITARINSYAEPQFAVPDIQLRKHMYDELEALQKQLSDVKGSVLHAKLLNAAIGALEAYTMTRPGFVSGIGEIIPL